MITNYVLFLQMRKIQILLNFRESNVFPSLAGMHRRFFRKGFEQFLSTRSQKLAMHSLITEKGSAVEIGVRDYTGKG